MKKLDASNFDAHKQRRLDHKSALLYLSVLTPAESDSCTEATRYTNPIKRKYRQKRLAADGTSTPPIQRAVAESYCPTFAADGAGAVPTSKRPNVQMPDEYLPPNKILFLQNLPETVTKDQLMALFSQYPNLYEVRLIPTKKDIAFVEFLDEGSATVAKDALHNYKLDGENKIKVRPPALSFADCRAELTTMYADHLRKKVRLGCRFAAGRCCSTILYCRCTLARITRCILACSTDDAGLGGRRSFERVKWYTILRYVKSVKDV